MLIGATLWAVVAGALDRYGQRSAPAGAWDAIVVAGCRVRPDGTASPALKRRTELAVELWREGRAPKIVLTGGVGKNPPSEARAAAAYAKGLGVPDDALVLEEKSTSTDENARYAADLIGRQRVLVVTDAYHVFRAERVFRRYFEDVRGVGSIGGTTVRVRGALREVAAVAVYAVLGRLRGP